MGADRVPDSGYLRAKVAQERIIAGGGVPHTVVRATQFFEFLGAIAQSSTVGETIYLSPAMVQNIAASDVVSRFDALRGLAEAVVASRLGDVDHETNCAVPGPRLPDVQWARAGPDAAVTPLVAMTLLARKAS